MYLDGWMMEIEQPPISALFSRHKFLRFPFIDLLSLITLRPAGTPSFHGHLGFFTLWYHLLSFLSPQIMWYLIYLDAKYDVKLQNYMTLDLVLHESYDIFEVSLFNI